MVDLDEIATSARASPFPEVEFILSKLPVLGEPLVLYIKGNFDVYSCDKFKSFLEANNFPYNPHDPQGLSETHGAERTPNRPDLFVDLDACYLDSTGLGMLLGLKKLAVRDSAQYKIITSDPKIKRIFKITGANKIFEIYSTLDEALESYTPRTLAKQ